MTTTTHDPSLDFKEYFPLSAARPRARHQRLYKLKDRALSWYFRFFPLRELLDERKIRAGTIPVVINNFNRYASLKILVDWLLQLSQPVSLIILDNKSTYPPLLAYYRTLNHPQIQVVRLPRNYELSMILPVSLLLQNFTKYVVTDADLIPYNTPADILEKMMIALDRRPDLNHIGASLEIEDIPVTYPFYKEVKLWEGQYWTNRMGKDGFLACIDTTFAMYRRDSAVYKIYPAMRLDRPYTLKHVDWYVNPENVSEEYSYYLDRCSNVSTWNTKYKSENKKDAALAV